MKQKQFKALLINALYISLVYYRQTEDVESATVHEKQLKRWNRTWKLDLIEKDNPERKDLS